MSDKLFSMSRRAVLGRAALLAGGSILPACARAGESYPPLGTYPESSSGESVFVGIALPRTGTYAQQGEDELRGYELAIAHINEGNELIRKISPKTTKGVLGKTIVHGVADSQAKPNIAVQAQSRFVSENKSVLMTGGASSASAIALNRLAARDKVLYLVGTSGANETTGKDCSRYSFRENFSASMAAAAVGPVLVKSIGRDKKVAYLTPDYAFGHSVQESIEAAVKAGGWTTVTNQVAPLGSADYSSYLLNIANSGADVFLNINYGGDAVRATQQAQQFGILKTQVLGIPYYTPFLAREVGPEIMAGVYCATDFWWTLEDKYPLAKMFVAAFEQKYGAKPEWGANAAYLELAFWAAMVEAAGTFYPPEVIKAFEKGTTLQSTVGDVHFRAEDHQLVRPVVVMRGKAKAAMSGPEDFFDIVEVVPGDGVMPSIEATGCKLGGYT